MSVALKRGDLVDNNLVFWARDPSMANGVRLVTKEKFDFLMRKHNEQEIARYHRCEKTKALAKKRAKQWKKRNPDRAKECNKKWADANKESLAVSWALRRLRIKANPLSPVERSMIRELYRARRRIQKCTGINFHVDHILALANGGDHHPRNLQLLPAKINLKKGARQDDKFKVNAAFPSIKK